MILILKMIHWRDDPGDGHITHLVLREGHFWDKKDVTIPVSEIDRLDEDEVFLKLDRRAIEKLPAIPVRRRLDLLSLTPYFTGRKHVILISYLPSFGR